MKRRRVIPVLLMLLGLWQVGEGGWIHAKAWLAQQLIASAWQQTLANGRPHRPWPWADTYPVARLRVPRLNVEQWVLSDASGRSLAFGPGHLTGTALPGELGHSVFIGHKDTHFRFLRVLQAGDELRVQNRQGQWNAFQAAHTAVIHQDDISWWDETDTAQLTLSTCYPFDSLMPGTPLRYLVTMETI